MAYSLIKVSSAQEWQDYHAIRKAELFADCEYDENHTDEYLPQNHPLLLQKDSISIATARLDVMENGLAALRLVAVAKNHQGTGTGRQLQELAEEFALNLDIKKLLVNAAPEAIGYYEKMGFFQEVWDKSELQGIAKDCTQMTKEINS